MSHRLSLPERWAPSVDTIKSWESRRRNPTGLAAKILEIIKENPEIYRLLEVR